MLANNYFFLSGAAQLFQVIVLAGAKAKRQTFTLHPGPWALAPYGAVIRQGGPTPENQGVSSGGIGRVLPESSLGMM